MNLRQRIFESLYRQAPDVAALPWHREDAPPLLQRVIAQRGPAGRALDVGCGEGVSSAYLAGKGYSVIGVDFVAAALDLARKRTQQAGAAAQFVQADVLDYSPEGRFDVVLDSGCLHHIPNARIPRYCERLEQWLQPGGDYVLIHFGKRHALDWRPVGPRRAPRDAIVRLFPALQLREYDETYYDLPFPTGRSRAGVYWFTR